MYFLSAVNKKLMLIQKSATPATANRYSTSPSHSSIFDERSASERAEHCRGGCNAHATISLMVRVDEAEPGGG
jgi:putative heme iron utilization protein